MKTSTRSVAVFAVMLFSFSLPSNAGELIYSQLSDNQSTFGPSQLWSASGVNSEIADDFNVVANIDRVVAEGFIWGSVDFQGVYVRFYTFGADNKPGTLQQEYFFAPGNPNLVWNQNGLIDATLPNVFAATGQHFLSVQVVSNYWYWWSSSTNAPRGEAFYFRDNANGEGWHHGDNLNFNTNADVVFALYGTVTGAGTITSLSDNALPRSGYLQIFGNNFGGDGTVTVGGINAQVADWTSTRIIAYVPENAPLSSLPVQVNSAAGASNTLPLTVTTRPAGAEHVNWRFRMNGPYSFVRPAIGSDGTVYSIDGFAHLYALAPDGGLKWLVRGAGDKGVSVGPEGTIYVASESFIKAYNPNGTEKWTFVQTPRAFICLGVSVGPDGNIYSVGTQGMGVFSLTPQGTLRWTYPEPYRRLIVDYAEIVFGPNGSNQQLYFYANDHLRAFTLDGALVFTNSTGEVAAFRAGLQPAIAPDGSVHTALWSYTPNGDLIWFFQTQYPYNVFTPADIGPDGTHYFVQNLSRLFALNPNGSQRWEANVNGYVGGPIIDPLNTQLVMGSQETGDHAGYIISVSRQDGHELWRVVLPIEDPTVWNPGVGIFGFNQFVDTRGRFTPNGQTAYFITSTATGDNDTSKSFVYSLNAGNGSPLPSPSPTATATATATAGVTPTPTASASQTPQPTATATATPFHGRRPRLLNFSTRMRVSAGFDVGIGGFIVSGTVPKPVLIRAIGPSLASSGVTNPLGDPVLELHGPNGFATIMNDNWRQTQETEIQATGIPPVNDLESAILVTLAPGPYTAIVRSDGDSSGVALVEAYDLGQSDNSKMANLSTRALVSSGDDIVIAGFVAGGDEGTTRVVARGIGPSLSAAGVSGALTDPMLELRDRNGTLVASNDNWQDDAIQAADIVAANLAPTNPQESAIAATVTAGPYTALLSGVNAGTGVGVVEVYDLGQ